MPRKRPRGARGVGGGGQANALLRAVLKVHTSDGRTSHVDLQDAEQARQLLLLLGDSQFQSTITGLTLTHLGVQYSLPRPAGFDSITFLAEAVEAEQRVKGGERITCLAGDVRATVMAHREQRAARVALFRIGKQRYSPLLG